MKEDYINYKGNLFGKVGNTYFPIGKNTDYFDKLEEKANPPEDMLVEFANLCIQYPNESRSGLWDECLKNWELD